MVEEIKRDDIKVGTRLWCNPSKGGKKYKGAFEVLKITPADETRGRPDEIAILAPITKTGKVSTSFNRQVFVKLGWLEKVAYLTSQPEDRKEADSQDIILDGSSV